MTALVAGLAFGLVGSGHCAAMCGPLVLLANPKSPGLGQAGAVPSRARAVHAGLYHLGRLATYLALGAIVGIAGTAMARLGLARGLAVAAGVALVMQALVAMRVVSARLESHRLASVVSRALGRAGTWMRTHRVRGPIVFGALNGLLPCGLVYAALTAAAGFGDFSQALVFMGAFAVGTTPLLALVAVAGGAVSARVPPRLRRAAPVALAIVGILLIARGLRAPHAHAVASHPDTPAVHAPQHMH
jgi:uncharacterized protein